MEITKNRIHSKSIANQIYQGEILFENYNKNEVITTACTQMGYTVEKMTEGQTLLNNLKTEIDKKDQLYAEQIDTTAKLNQALKIANETYMKNLKIAKICFKNDFESKKLLELEGGRELVFANKIEQLRKFYTNIIKTDIIAKMNEIGVTIETITADKKTFDKVVELDSLQEQKKGEARNQTLNKDKVQEEYIEWIEQLRKCLKINLKDNPILDSVLIRY